MSRFAAILLATVLGSAGTAAFAADDGVKEARKQAKATYNMDRKGCAALKDDERKDCLRRAKAEYNQQITEVRKMKKAHAAEDKAARAEKSDEKRRAKVHSGGDRSNKESSSGSSGTPEPGRYMGKAPESANTPPPQESK